MEEINCTLKKLGASASRLFLCLCLLGGLFLSTNSSAQTCPAQSCPNLPGQIIADGNPCEWGLNNLNTFAIKSYRLDAFGNGVVDSQFTLGSKDFFQASDLGWSVSQTKAKNDIANGAAVLIGSTLYFAGDRTSNNGAAQIGFWFYLNGTGPTTQPDGTMNFAPEHAVGDLLVLADFSNGGTLATVSVYQWVGTGGNVVGSNGTLNTTTCTGIVAQNNATTYQIPQGWSFLRPCYAENEFYEGEIDLTCLTGGGTANLCFSSFLLETRSSPSITASLDDFVSGAFGGQPAVPTIPGVSRCGAGSVTLTATCTGSTVRWYTASSGGSPIVTGGIYTVSGSSLTINPINGTTEVYASCYNAALNCESDRVLATATVITANPGVIAGSQTLCTPFDPAAFTSTTPGSGGTVTYQWQSSTTSCAAGFTDIGGATSATYDAGAVAVTTYYRRVTTVTAGTTVCSANSNCLTVTPNPVTPGSIAGDQTLCTPFDPAAFTSVTLGTGGATPTYQWQSSTTSCATGFTDITGATSATYDAGAVAVTTYFRRVATSTLNNVVCSANSNCVTVTPNPVTPGSIAGDQTLCTPFDPAAFTSVTLGTGGATPTYQWQSSTTSCATGFTSIEGATSATYDAGAVAVTTYFRRVATSTLNGVPCSANSNCVTVTPNAVTPGSIAGDQTLCTPFDPAAFTSVTLGTGGATPTYQWQSSTTSCATGFTNITGATSATYDAGAVAITTYFRRVATSTLNGVLCSANSNCVTVTPNPVTPGSVAGGGEGCSPFDAAAFTSVTLGTGGATPTYQWQSSTTSCAAGFTDIVGATAATYDPGAVVVTTYYRRVATSTLNGVLCSSNSNCLTVTPTGITPGSIAGSQTLCTPFDPAAFTSTTGATGDGVVTYQWQSSTTSCAAGFTDIVGATAATYDAGAVAVTTYFRRLATSTLGAAVCTAASNCLTVTPNAITPGSIAGDQTLCTPFDPAAFTSVTLGTGGATPTYQWQISTTSCATGFTNIEGATSATYDAGAVAVTTYFRRVATSTLNNVACSANSNCVTVTPNPVTPGSIAGDQTLCTPFDPAAFTSVTLGTGGATPTYQWQSSTTSCATGFSNITGATSATYDAGAVAVTTYFRRVATSTLNGVPCAANSNCVTVTPNPVTPGSIAGDQTVCTPFNPAAFTSVTLGTGGATPTYQWQSSTTSCAAGFTDIVGATSATYDAGAVAVTTYFRRVATSTLNGVLCSANSNCVTVTPNPITPGTIVGPGPICTGGNPGNITVGVAASGPAGATISYQWQSGAGTCATATFAPIVGATGATYDPPAGLNVTTSYRRVTTSTLNGVPCSDNTNCVTVTVVENPIIYVPVAGDFCANFPNTGTVTLPGSQVGVNYTLIGDNTLPVPGQPVKAGTGGALTWTGLGAGGYLVQASGAGPTNCANLTNPAVVDELPVPTVVADNKEICVGESVALTGTPAGGTWTGTGVTGSTFNSSGLSPGQYTVTYTVINNSNPACQSSDQATITVNSCNDAICTYTQGAYGSAGGLMCDGINNDITTSEMIAQSITNLVGAGGTLRIGRPGHSVTVTVATGDCVMDRLPGGGSSKELLAGDYSLCNLPDSYLKNDRINNTLLAQSLTLQLNLGITSPSNLGSFVLQAGTLATANPLGGCGSNTATPRVCNYTAGVLTSVTNEYTYRTFTASLIAALAAPKNVQSLMNLANDALANVDGIVGWERGVKISAIAEAADAINNVFDECMVVVGWNIAPCPPTQGGVSITQRTTTVDNNLGLNVTTYPNPFTDQVKFVIASPVSGKGTLEVYSLAGQKLSTVYSGQVFAGKSQTVNFKVPDASRQSMIYILKVGSHQAVGKLMNIE